MRFNRPLDTRWVPAALMAATIAAMASHAPLVSTVSARPLSILSQPDTYEVTIGETLEVSAGDGVLKNDDVLTEVLPATTELVSGATYGQVTLRSDGSFTYTPPPAVPPFGIDGFYYRAN